MKFSGKKRDFSQVFIYSLSKCSIHNQHKRIRYTDLDQGNLVQFAFGALRLPFSVAAQASVNPNLHSPAPVSKYMLAHNLEHDGFRVHVKVVPFGVSAN